MSNLIKDIEEWSEDRNASKVNDANITFSKHQTEDIIFSAWAMATLREENITSSIFLLPEELKRKLQHNDISAISFNNIVVNVQLQLSALVAVQEDKPFCNFCSSSSE